METIDSFCKYIAAEYFIHPIINKFLYQIYTEKVTINTKPTNKGKSLKIYDYFFVTKRI